MKLYELLGVAASSITIKCGNNYVDCVSADNPLISKDVFQAKIISIESRLDAYDNGILEVEIDQNA